MRPQKVDDQQLLSGLMTVFRTKGYDGASLNELAAASGLQKASLYHRFPGGKKDLAIAVLNYVDEWIESNIVKVLTNKKEAPHQRLANVLSNIDFIYASGKSACVLRALSMDSGLLVFDKELKSSFGKWIHAFKEFGIEIGINRETSNRLAKEVIVKVQGSLVVAKSLSDHSLFTTALSDIKNMYLK